MNKDYLEIAKLISDGEVSESIKDVASKAMEVLGEITSSQSSEIVGLDRWRKMYETRKKTLLQKQRLFGGFDETLAAVSVIANPVDLTLLESNKFVSMFLVDRIEKTLIGALYIERDPQTL